MKYLDKSYNELIADLNYGYNEPMFKNSSEWEILRSLYERNYLGYCHSLNSSFLNPSIPRILHQVWLGGELPLEYKKYSDTWRAFHPDWEYNLWLDEHAEVFPFQNKQAFEDAPTKGQKSDIFRYEILRKYGGLYVDTDFECLKSFDDLMYLEFFTGSGYVDKVELYIGLIACTPNHPIINRMVDTITGVNKHNSVWDVFKTTGSWRFTECFFDMVDKNTEWVCAFPHGYFYPWPNNDRSCHNPEKYIKPYSYAIHRWEVSWLLRNK